MMKKLAWIGLSLCLVPGLALSKEVCTGGMIQKGPQPVHDEDDPTCPPARCADACVGIPASAAKTGETVSVYPHPNRAFNFKLNREGVAGAIQEYCYTMKNWGDEDERSFSLCVQYKDE
jgi:hypothetical protein